MTSPLLSLCRQTYQTHSPVHHFPDEFHKWSDIHSAWLNDAVKQVIKYGKYKQTENISLDGCSKNSEVPYLQSVKNTQTSLRVCGQTSLITMGVWWRNCTPSLRDSFNSPNRKPFKTIRWVGLITGQRVAKSHGP